MTDVRQQLISTISAQLSARVDDLLQLVLSAHFGRVPSVEALRGEQVSIASKPEGEARRYTVWRKDLQIGAFLVWLKVDDGKVTIEFDEVEILPAPSVRKITGTPELFACIDKQI